MDLENIELWRPRKVVRLIAQSDQALPNAILVRYLEISLFENKFPGIAFGSRSEERLDTLTRRRLTRFLCGGVPSIYRCWLTKTFVCAGIRVQI